MVGKISKTGLIVFAILWAMFFIMVPSESYAICDGPIMGFQETWYYGGYPTVGYEGACSTEEEAVNAMSFAVANVNQYCKADVSSSSVSLNSDGCGGVVYIIFSDSADNCVDSGTYGGVYFGCCTAGQTQPCSVTETTGYSYSGTQACTGDVPNSYGTLEIVGLWGTCNNSCSGNATLQCTTTGPTGIQCSGTQACSGGAWGACQPDASCPQCIAGQQQTCTTGCPVSGGTQSCTSAGQWGMCVCADPCDTGDCGNNPCGNTTNTGSSANLKSGNLTHNQNVITAPKSLPFALTYNSNDTTIGPLGRGWTHNYNVLISAVTTSGFISGVILTENSGNKIRFSPSVGLYSTLLYPSAGSGDTSTITLMGDGSFIRILKDGTLQTFNTSGILTSITDRNNNTTTLSYSGNNLVSITDSTGRSLGINAGSGQITAITDPAGQTYNFTYNGTLLTAVSDPAGNAWNYTYDPSGRMLTKTDPAGFQTAYTYDVNGILISTTDPNGLVKTITYNQAGNTAQFVEIDGGVWNDVYDSTLNLPLQSTDPYGNVTSYTYDGNGNMLTKTDPDGNLTTYTYDAMNNVTSVTNALGQTISYTYNSKFAEVTSMTDPLGNSTAYTYDSNGNLLSTTDPLGNITTNQYATNGNETSTTNALNQTTTLTYDQYNNIASITDPSGAKTNFTYTINGKIASRADANGNATTFTYNSLNQLIQVVDPEGNRTIYAYDQDGNRTMQVDANGNATYVAYNFKRQPTMVKNALSGITSFNYTGTGCPSCGGGVDQLTALLDANGNTTSYTYDLDGRLITQTDPLGNTIKYSYDPAGNLTSMTKADGNTIYYAYDATARLLTKSYPDGSTTSFTYDAKGNILTATNDNISYTFTYDADGRVTSAADDYYDLVSYTYDAVGNRTQMIYPDVDATVKYTYNSANRLSKITDGAKNYIFTYDKAGKRTKLTYPNGVSARYTYDLSGKLTSLINTSSTGTIIASSAYTLDRVGNRLTTSGPNGENSYSYDSVYDLLSALPGSNVDYGPEEYTYDLIGNRLTGPKPNTAYTFNKDNQLVTENKQQFQYDNNGNLSSYVTLSTASNYSYDYENRLTQVVTANTGTTTTTAYYYDPFGRRFQKDVTTATTGTTSTTSTYYLYDGQSVIVENTDNAAGEEITSRYIQGPNIDEHLAMVRVNDNTYHYYHSDGLGSIVAITDKNQQVEETYTYSAFGVVDDVGNGISNHYRFAGREWDSEAGLYYYRTRYYDPKIGRFISKDPIAIWGNIYNNKLNISFYQYVDSVKNSYTYAGNNPVNFRDPFGLFWNPFSILPPFSDNPGLGIGGPILDIVVGGLEVGGGVAGGVASGILTVAGPENWVYSIPLAYISWDAGSDGVQRLDSALEHLGDIPIAPLTPVKKNCP